MTERKGGSMTRSGAAETATTFMGSEVSGSHEGRSIKFCVSLWGVVSCKGAASLLIPSVNLFSSVSVCFYHGAKWLVKKALAEHDITSELIGKRPLLCFYVLP